ncbi:MAG: 3-oxoadipyl-CoA thiolase, partial [Chloroflexi bacterium]|nr:3-oxoadipyl-CoA thiolase [Chloroflexota bacterium]
MKDAVIIDGVRTPVGNHGGALRTVLAKELLAHVFKAVIER